MVAPIVPEIAPVLPLRARPDGKLDAGTEYVTALPPMPSVAANSILFVYAVVSKAVRVAPAAGEVHIGVNPIVVVLVAERPAPFVTTTL